MTDFINAIPRIESHYLRSQTTREYVDGGKTLSDIYRDYKNECEQNQTLYGNYTAFRKVFLEKFNISFLVPKKTSDVCVSSTKIVVKMRNLNYLMRPIWK